MAIKHNYWYTDEQEKKRQKSWNNHIRSSYHQPEKIDARQNMDSYYDREYKRYGEVRPEGNNTYFNKQIQEENSEGNAIIRNKKPAAKTLKKENVRKSVDQLLNYRTTKKKTR